MQNKRMYRLGKIRTDNHTTPGVVDVTDKWLSEQRLLEHLVFCRNLTTVKVFVADVKTVSVCDNCGNTMEDE